MQGKSLRLFLTSVLLVTLAASQVPDSQTRPRNPAETNTPLQEDQAHQLQKKQREERAKKLKEDTAKLLELATELKASVDKSNENVLSLDVVKKAEEIEKLAKHIKTNMRDEVR